MVAKPIAMMTDLTVINNKRHALPCRSSDDTSPADVTSIVGTSNHGLTVVGLIRCSLGMKYRMSRFSGSCVLFRLFNHTLLLSDTYGTGALGQNKFI